MLGKSHTLVQIDTVGSGATFSAPRLLIEADRELEIRELISLLKSE